MSPSRNIYLEQIDHIDDFSELKEPWDHLLSDNDTAHPFLAWEWMFAWWKTYKTPNCKLLILLVKDVDNVVGIAPFYIRRSKRVFDRNTVYFLGTGEPEYMEVCSEYLDILVSKAYRKDFCYEISKYFKEINREWSTIKLSRFLHNSIINDYFIDYIIDQKFKLIKRKCGIRYLVKLPSSWDEYYKNLKPSFRRAIRVAYKRMHDQDCNVVLEPQNMLTVSQLMQDLERLHSRRWALVGKSGAFVSDEFKEFHDNIFQNLFKRDLLRLVAIKKNNEAIAVLYNFCLKDTTYYYQSGIDLDGHRLLSPGILAHCEAIKLAIYNKQKVYDFMMGDINSYKRKYNCLEEDMFNAEIYKNSMHAYALKLLLFFKKIIKNL